MTQCGPERQCWHIHCTKVLSDLIILKECGQELAIGTAHRGSAGLEKGVDSTSGLDWAWPWQFIGMAEKQHPKAWGKMRGEDEVE